MPQLKIIEFLCWKALESQKEMGREVHHYYLICFGYRLAACFEHRGTPESPARVPTLEPDEASICVRYIPTL